MKSDTYSSPDGDGTALFAFIGFVLGAIAGLVFGLKSMIEIAKLSSGGALLLCFLFCFLLTIRKTEQQKTDTKSFFAAFFVLSMVGLWVVYGLIFVGRWAISLI